MKYARINRLEIIQVNKINGFCGKFPASYFLKILIFLTNGYGHQSNTNFNAKINVWLFLYRWLNRKEDRRMQVYREQKELEDFLDIPEDGSFMRHDLHQMRTPRGQLMDMMDIL